MNVPLWWHIFQHIEQNTPGTCTITYHRMDTFELAYHSAFELMRNASPGILDLVDKKWVFPLKKIQALSFQSEDENPLIRSADLFAASVAYYINCALSDNEIPIKLHRIGFLALGVLLMDVMVYKYPQLGSPLNLGSISGSNG